MYECLTGKKGSKIQGCILADFMGLGKTLQTLTLIRCLLIKKVVNKVVVICPLTLIKVWERECLKWMGSKLNPLIAFGSSEEIAKVLRMFIEYEYRFLVASYEQFYKHSESLSAKCDLLIFDEGHRLKNKKSKLFKKILTFKCKKRILLTGTPIQNNLDELYTCIMLVNPSFF
jgi:SNF2 family DNA or RNA helicase